MAKTKFKRTKPHCSTGTIGRVDRDKATLAAATTKVLHDEYPGLNEPSLLDSINKAPEERQRGITISVAHVECQAGKHHYVHVDCPGHTDYVENMITGATQMGSATLVAAAADGPMAQAHEHILLIRQVGVPAIAVVLNRYDMIVEEGADLIDLVEMKLREILSAQEFDGDNLPTVRAAVFLALDGDGKWIGTILELTDVVDEYIPQPEHDIEKPFLMPAEDVFTITGHGIVIADHIERGIVRTGDTVDLVGVRPEKQTTTVIGVGMLRKILNEGRAGGNVGLPLRDTKKEDVERGMTVTKPGSTTLHIDFETAVCVFNKERGGRHKPLFFSYSPQFYFRTTDVTDMVQLPEGREMVMPDDNTDMTVHFNKPIAMEENLKFAIREGGRTIGASKVTKIIK